MSTPSLLNIPYRLKAGTLYSQLPETGAGDFTVTRTTTPTAVNPRGLTLSETLNSLQTMCLALTIRWVVR